MATKIRKSSDLGKIWFSSRFCSCELISVIVFGIGIHLPVKFSKDRIISLWEFGQTSSRREEEEE
jgi:hypothetical protein